MNDGEVVELRPRVPDEDAPVRRRRRGRYCQHHRVELDEGDRRVHCRDCGAELLAFEVLMNLAREYERWKFARDTAKRECKRRQQELEEVKRELRNAKARLRRATR